MEIRVFSIVDTALLILTFHFFMTASLLLYKQQQGRIHYLLLGVIFLEMLGQLHALLVVNQAFRAWFISYELWPYYSILGVALYLSGPALYFYIRSVTDKKIYFNRLALLPLVIAVLLFSYDHSYFWMFSGEAGGLAINKQFVVGVYFISAIYAGMSLFYLHEVKQRRREERAGKEKIDNLFSGAFVNIVATFWVVRFFASLAALLVFSGDLLDMLQTSILAQFFAANVFLFAFIVYMNSTKITVTLGGSAVRKSARANDHEQISKIEKAMKVDKLHLINGVTLEHVAESVSMNPRKLSNIINIHHNKNFPEFVNHYRVEEAKKMLRDSNCKNKTIQEILEECGFNSKSTFNTLFKKIVGVTPTEYRS